MGYLSNREPRRQWSSERHHARVSCESCGAPARLHSAEPPFCDVCLDWSRQHNLAEWDELGAGD
ncbi:MAG: hypothetical protein R3B48_28885 [Kofleriaceae bacterium]